MSTNKPCVHYITITRNSISSLHDKKLEQQSNSWAVGLGGIFSAGSFVYGIFPWHVWFSSPVW